MGNPIDDYLAALTGLFESEARGQIRRDPSVLE
jgi:hypothetical protein